MIEVPKGNEGDVLTWNIIANERARKGRWCEFTCPNGHQASVAKKVHTIAPDGVCSPSFVCAAAERTGCTFHEFVRLLDWKPEYAEWSD